MIRVISAFNKPFLPQTHCMKDLNIRQMKIDFCELKIPRMICLDWQEHCIHIGWQSIIGFGELPSAH